MDSIFQMVPGGVSRFNVGVFASLTCFPKCSAVEMEQRPGALSSAVGLVRRAAAEWSGVGAQEKLVSLAVLPDWHHGKGHEFCGGLPRLSGEAK